MYDLLQLMYQDGYLSSTELTALRKTCRDLRENPVRVLRSLNIVSQPEIQGLLQRFYGLDSATDELVENMDEGLRHLMPVDLALNYSAVAIGDHDGHLFVLLEDPTDTRTLHCLEFFLGRPIRPVVATATQIARALSRAYGAETGDLRLTTLLEAARGIEGGAVYDPSQITPFSKEDELLVDKGERYGTLRDTLREGAFSGLPSRLGGTDVSRSGGEQRSKLRTKALPEPTLAPPLPDSDPDALAAHLASAHFGALPDDSALPPAPTPASAKPKKAAAAVKSVFDDFEGMETIETIDPALAEANDGLLAEANDSLLPGVDTDELEPGLEAEAEAESFELGMDGEAEMTEPGMEGDSGEREPGLDEETEEEVFGLDADAGESELGFDSDTTEFVASEESAESDEAHDGLSLDSLGGDDLTNDTFGSTPSQNADGEAIPGDFDDSFDDDLLNADSTPPSAPATAPRGERERPQGRAASQRHVAPETPAPVALSAPASKAISAAVSQLLVKLALARGLEDACLRANAVLGPAGFRLEPGASGGVIVEETTTGARSEIGSAADLDLLPPSAAPLAPALRQLFRGRTSA